MELQQKTDEILKLLYIDFFEKRKSVKCLTGAPVPKPDKSDPDYDPVDYPPYNTVIREVSCIYDGLNKNEVYKKCNFHDKSLFENILFELLCDYKFIEYSDENLEISQREIFEYGVLESDIVGRGPKEFIRLTYAGYKDAKKKYLSDIVNNYTQIQTASMPEEVSFCMGLIRFGNVRPYQPHEDLKIILDRLWGNLTTVKFSLFYRMVNKGYPLDILSQDVGCERKQLKSKCETLNKAFNSRGIPIKISVANNKARLVLIEKN